MLMLNEIGIVFRVIQFENTEKSGKKVDLFYVQTFCCCCCSDYIVVNKWLEANENEQKKKLYSKRVVR